ncbi:MAG: hypothetical protein NVSMB57_03510 [Actinomycetota bacterium]
MQRLKTLQRVGREIVKADSVQVRLQREGHQQTVARQKFSALRLLRSGFPPMRLIL